MVRLKIYDENDVLSFEKYLIDLDVHKESNLIIFSGENYLCIRIVRPLSLRK